MVNKAARSFARTSYTRLLLIAQYRTTVLCEHFQIAYEFAIVVVLLNRQCCQPTQIAKPHLFIV